MSYFYLATPYSKYPKGIEEAFKVACRATAELIRHGIPVLSPIAHSHPIAIHGGIDPLSHDIWLNMDKPLMDAAFGLLVLCAEGWQDSYGMNVEINAFSRAYKPILFIRDGIIDKELVRCCQELILM